MKNGDLTISEICSRGLLYTVFQPIISLRNGDVLGFEALTRGPEDSPMHSPAALFDAAVKEGVLLSLDAACRRCALQSFAANPLPGKLFLNMTPSAFWDLDRNIWVAFLESLSLQPSQIVLEITEAEQVADHARMRRVINVCRELGVAIAIDDLGAGYSGLRLWAEIEPEFVKIDKALIAGLSNSRMKSSLLDSIQLIAQKSKTITIAEGIETEEDLFLLARSGIDFGQGYFLGRPSRSPNEELDEEVKRKLSRQTKLTDVALPTAGRIHTVSAVMRHALTFHARQTVDDVLAVLIESPDIHCGVVLDHQRPIGIIGRAALLNRFAKPYQRELFGRRSCTTIMTPNPLVFDLAMSIQEVSFTLANATERDISECFILTDDGEYCGIGISQDVMREITTLQVNAARYANPLTQLPGNVPLNEEIDRLLSERTGFVVAYVDIDNFKPYNDVFGYRQGDDVIVSTSRVLAAHCDPERDFLGHIGGDDFLIVFRSDDWEERCRNMLAGFAEMIPDHVSNAAIEAGGYVSLNRTGEEVCHPIPSLSIGVVKIEKDFAITHMHISTAAADAKKQAKAIKGNSLFIERRTISSGANSGNPNASK